MPSELAPLPNWLSTSQAAAYLGVHPNTIRRWADDGKLTAMVTPGGHRRFSQEDLRAFEWRQRQEAHSELGANWTSHALSITRSEIATTSDASWLQAYDDAARREQRDLGRRLLGLILRYVSGIPATSASWKKSQPSESNTPKQPGGSVSHSLRRCRRVFSSETA